MNNSSAKRWSYVLAAGGALVCISGFLPWASTIGGVAQGRPSMVAAIALIVFGAVPTILAQRLVRHRGASAARAFMWVFSSIDLVGWLFMCLAILLASSIGLQSFAHPDAGFFLCFIGLITVFVSTVFVHARSASTTMDLAAPARGTVPEPIQQV
jgi:hypothetical protein